MKIRSFTAVFSLLLLPVVVAVGDPSAKNILFIFDGSGSMWGELEGQTKIEIARRVLTERIQNLSPDLHVGLMAYGHRRKGDCNDIEMLVEPSSLDKNELLAKIKSIKPTGKTPIASSIKKAVKKLGDHTAESTIILMTDGRETCSADPCGQVKKFREQAGFNLHVVGFDIVGEEDALQLRCLAEAGGGNYYTASTIEGLDHAFKEATGRSHAIPAFLLAQENFEIVLDQSEAMEGPFEQTTRIKAARQALTKILEKQVADRDNLAFRWFGGACGGDNTERVFDFQQNSSRSILDKLPNLKTAGKTTLVEAINQAASDFHPPERFANVNKYVIIITGGIDPCYSRDESLTLIRQRLTSLQIRPEFRFIGLDIPPDKQQQLKRLAEATKGDISLVKTQVELEQKLKKIFELDPVDRDVKAIFGNLNELITLFGEAIDQIEAKDYQGAGERIAKAPEIEQRFTLPFRDLSRRKGNVDYQKLFDVARELYSVETGMTVAVKSMLAHHQSGDREAYNEAVRDYNQLTGKYSGSVDTANQIMSQLWQ
ncbi:MAG: VWA domain-containing protein [Pseudomonadota bacterium]